MKHCDFPIPPLLSELRNKFQNSKHSFFLTGETVASFLMKQQPYLFKITTSATKQETMQLLQINDDNMNHVLPGDIVAGLDEKTQRFYPLHHDFCTNTNASQPLFMFHSNSDLSPNQSNKHSSDILFSPDNLIWDFQHVLHNEMFEQHCKQGTFPAIQNKTNNFTDVCISTLKSIRYTMLWGSSKFQAELFPFSSIPNNLSKHEKIRIKQEWIRIFELPSPGDALDKLKTCRLLSTLFPEITEGCNVEQNQYHAYDVYYHGIHSCNAGKTPFIRFVALLHDIGKPRAKRSSSKNHQEQNTFYDHETIGARMSRKLLKRFHFHPETVRQTCKLVQMHMFHYTREWTDRAIRRFIIKANKDLELLFQLREADRAGSGMKSSKSKAIAILKQRIDKVLEEQKKFTVQNLDINGYQIMNALNLESGPEIGKILKFLLHQVENGFVKNKKDVLLQTIQQTYDTSPILT